MRRRTVGRRISVFTSHIIWWMCIGGSILLHHH